MRRGLLFFACLAVGACEVPTTASTAGRSAVNQQAFARLYGVLRWFHPSDEAAALDWNRYAVVGIERVRDAANAPALEAALEALVAPIAPTVQIVHAGEAVEGAPPPPPGSQLTWWQHVGAGLGETSPLYTSKRRGRLAPGQIVGETIEPFPEGPGPGEVATVELGDGLRAIVPLTVASVDGKTVPAGDPTVFRPELAKPGNEVSIWIADVVITWNVFAHFYPYFDVIGVDWDRALGDALADAADDRTADDHIVTLEHLVARARDGHGFVKPKGGHAAAPPIALAEAEGKLVVVGSTHRLVQRGDVLEAIDGVPVAAALDVRLRRVSGSPQYTRDLAIRRLLEGPHGSEAGLRLRRGKTTVDVRVPRLPPPRVSPPRTEPPIREVAPAIWYVDLDRAETSAIEQALPKLAVARGVVFDLRGYPRDGRGTADLLRHIIRKPDDADWMFIAQIVRPFQADLIGYDGETFELTPAEPHLDNVVFITGSGAISAAESILGYVEHEGIPVVGAASAGTNGNVRSFVLPGGAKVFFTGMRVLKHDGSQHHLIGVVPTVLAAPTLAGTIAGDDEVLARAIDVVARRVP